MSVIFHIDINAFFASAHAITDPKLLGKPVVVCSNHRGSVITTASYEARKYGIQSAMPLAYAKRLCEDLVVIDIDFDLYHDLSQRFIKIIMSYSEILEQASIDECYVDVTEIIKTYKRPLDLAVDIQKRVYKELLLPISIGVAPNKFLAKMASDMRKPMGIQVLRIREVEELLWPMDIADMFGIGKKTVPKLKEIGILTIGDLAVADPNVLRKYLGINTETFIQRANGIDSSPIEVFTPTKSIGQSKTFTNPMTDLDEIRHAIMSEIEQLTLRLNAKDLCAKTVTFSIRLDDFKTAARSTTLDSYIYDKNSIFERVMGLYDEFDGLGAVSFISISLTNLISKDDRLEQLNIFDDIKNPSIDEIILRLNKTLKYDAFKRSNTILKGDK